MLFGKDKKQIEDPEILGRTDLYDENGNKLTFKFLAPLKLHPCYKRLIIENKEELFEEFDQKDLSFEVTKRFKEEAEKLYEKGENNFSKKSSR